MIIVLIIVGKHYFALANRAAQINGLMTLTGLVAGL